MTSEFDWNQVQAHLQALIPERSDELRRMEAQADEEHFPIIGPVCGHLCYQLARTLNATKIFELGSGFGYSTAWFARAVAENGGGLVYHVVWDEDLSRRARHHLTRLGLAQFVKFVVGEAVQTLRETDGPFDIIFNDIDKDGYPEALDAAAERLRRGGVLIADNVLWHGRIFDETDQSPETVGIRTFTHRVTSDSRWAATIAPIRDGMLFATRVA